MNSITLVLLRSFIINITLSLVKILSGLLGSSGALVADGLHSLSDTATDIFAIIGNKLSVKPADDKHPFGHGRMENITCLGIGIIVLFMGLSIIYKAFTNEQQIPSMFVALIGLIVVFVKFILAKYILKCGKEYNSNILLASGKESLSDVISSVVVLISVVIAQLSKYNNVFIYADAVAMILVGILILKIAYTIFKDNISGLLGEQVTDLDYINNIKNIIKNEPEIQKIDTLVILKYGPFYHINCEVGMNKDISLKESHDILEKIESNIQNYDTKIHHIIIHVNPY